MLFSKIVDSPQQLVNEIAYLLDLALHMQLEVNGHLVVAAAGSVQFLSCLAYALCEQRLYVHVDIFTVDRKFHLPGFDVALYRKKSGYDLIRFFLR